MLAIASRTSIWSNDGRAMNRFSILSGIFWIQRHQQLYEMCLHVFFHSGRYVCSFLNAMFIEEALLVFRVRLSASAKETFEVFDAGDASYMRDACFFAVQNSFYWLKKVY